MADSYSLKAILSADGSSMSSTFDKISSQVGGLQKTLLGGIGFGAMSAIGSRAIDLVGSGVKGLGATVMDSGMSFEAAGSQIAATMGTSKDNITDIIDEAARLGSTTAFTATQAASGFNTLAMSGLDAKEQIATMAPVLDLAAAGSYNLDSAASQVVGTIKGYGDSFSDARRYADMFAKGATLASTDVNALGVAMSDSAATAAGYGQEADRTAIALLRLADQNVTGSEAATNLSRAMMDLYTPTSSAAKQLAALGVSVYDSSGKARDFNTVVDELSGAMSGMSDEEKNAAKNAIFSTYGLQAFNKMTVTSTDKVKEFETGLASASDGMGSAATQAAEQLNNLQGQMTKLSSATEGLGITVFNSLGGSFTSAAQWATGAIDKINASLKNGRLNSYLSSGAKYLAIFGNYAKRVGAAFGTAFGAVWKSLGKLNGSFGSLKSLTSFADVCSVAAGALTSFAGFIEKHSSAIAQLITMLPKIGAGFLALKAASGVAGIVTGVGGAFASLASTVASGIGAKLATTATGMSQAGSAAMTSTGPMLAAAKSFMMIGAGLALTAVAFGLLAQSAIALAGAGAPAVAVMAGLVIGVGALSAGMMALVTHAAATAAQMNAAGSAFLMIGAAVLLVAAGFALMAQSAIALTNAGTPAIAMFAGMVAAMALLAVGAAALAPALTAGSVGLIAFGAAVLLVGAGVLVAAAGIALISASLPTVATYGTTAAAAFMALSTSALTLSVSLITLTASGTLFAAMLAAQSIALVAGTASMTAFAASVTLASGGMTLLAGSAALVLASVSGIADKASSAADSLSDMESSLSIVESGMNALEGVVTGVMSAVTSAVENGSRDVITAAQTGADRTNAVITAGGSRAMATVNNTVAQIVATMNRGATMAAVAGINTGNGYASGIASAQGAAASAAAALVSSAISSMNGGYGSAYSAGSYIGQGLAAGLASQAGNVASQAAALASAANAAIQAKAQIGSPSKVQIQNGKWTGEGYAIGLMKAGGLVERQASKLAAIPSKVLNNASADFRAFGERAELDESLTYSRDNTIIVKTYLDKREIGRASVEAGDDYRKKNVRRYGVRG